MNKNYLIILLAIFSQIGIVNAQFVTLQNCSVKSYLMKTYDPLNKKFQNGEPIDLDVVATSDNTVEIGVYLSFDKVLDPINDKLIANQQFKKGEFSARLPYTIPCDNAYTGKLYVFFYGDYQNKIAETNETDNIRMDTIEIEQSYPCGVQINNVRTNLNLSPNYNNLTTSFSSWEFSNVGISCDFQYINYTIANLNFNKTYPDYLSFYLSTETYFDEKLAIELYPSFNIGDNKDTLLPSMSTTTFKINNLKYYNGFNNLEGNYYLYIVSTQYQRGLNSLDKGLEAIGRSSRLKLGDFTGNINDDFNKNLAKLITLNSPYSVNLSNYLKGREARYGSVPACFTSKVAANSVDYFVKFKATEPSMTISLNADDASLESVVELLTSPKTCNNNVQSGNNVRNYTFDNLTIGNEYTVRVEFGGDAPIGYARMEALTNTTVTLKSGTVTSLSTAPTILFSIYPNPSNDGRFSVNTNETITQIKVTNTLGQTEVFGATSEIKTSLKGLLFVEVLTLNGKATTKVVVE